MYDDSSTPVGLKSLRAKAAQQSTMDDERPIETRIFEEDERQRRLLHNMELTSARKPSFIAGRDPTEYKLEMIDGFPIYGNCRSCLRLGTVGQTCPECSEPVLVMMTLMGKTCSCASGGCKQHYWNPELVAQWADKKEPIPGYQDAAPRITPTCTQELQPLDHRIRDYIPFELRQTMHRLNHHALCNDPALQPHSAWTWCSGKELQNKYRHPDGRLKQIARDKGKTGWKRSPAE